MKKVFSFLIVIIMAKLSFSKGLVNRIVVIKITNENPADVTILNPALYKCINASPDRSIIHAGKPELNISYIVYSTKSIEFSFGIVNWALFIQNVKQHVTNVIITSSIAIQRKNILALSVNTPEEKL